jgi:UDP-3-O-[3-hydroxymyristoyl] glucosamine N-acyltransferase
VKIGEKAVILGQTGVTKSVKGNAVYAGNPIQEARQLLKETAFLRNQVNSKK